MTTPEQLRQSVRALLDSQMQGALATQYDRQPYSSLMAFAVTPDLRWIVFATYRATRKYKNLVANPHASLLVDNRTNMAADYRDTVAISAEGKVHAVDGAWHDELQERYLRKHPDLKDFVTAADCVLLQLDVDSYSIVSQFQNVVKLRMA